jgi:tetraprenyl-beta-curcumene synthase
VRTQVNRRLKLAIAFVLAAGRYWLGVFPAVCGEARHLRRRARHVPDAELRKLAIHNLQTESGNLEGAAAFAAFLPHAHRDGVVRAQVAFQAAYDYVDSLAEQPHSVLPVNVQRLHRALVVAVSPGVPHLDYYARHAPCDDDGYLVELLDICRGTVSRLPSYALVADAIRRNAQRIVGYQTRTNLASANGRQALILWASRETPPETDLRWWETGAACGSSMAVLALLAAAADPRLTRSAANAIEAVYWPWAGALHSLLDSLIDRAEDATAGHHNLTTHYASSQEMAGRMQAITTEAARRASAVGVQHSLVLAGMISLYLSDRQAWLPATRPTTERVLAALGGLATPAMLVLRARRLAHRSSGSLVAPAARAVRAGRERNYPLADILQRTTPPADLS